MSRCAAAAVEALTGPRPPLKWAGGKGWMTDEIRRHMPPSYGRYFEPFVGGGALFFALQPERAILSDLNAELIDCYRAIRDDVEKVIECLGWHAQEYGKMGAQHYYEARSFEPMSPEHDAARMIFLNKTGYNGLYRVNLSGRFNVPHGRTASGEPPTICDADNLRACSRALRDALIAEADFRIVLSGSHEKFGESFRLPRPEEGDLIYADPPYDGTFTGYTAGGFSDARQEQLAVQLRAMQARGVYVMASNADTPRVRELYRGFRMISVKKGRPNTMSSKTSDRGRKQPELLILGEGCP